MSIAGNWWKYHRTSSNVTSFRDRHIMSIENGLSYDLSLDDSGTKPKSCEEKANNNVITDKDLQLYDKWWRAANISDVEISSVIREVMYMYENKILNETTRPSYS